MVGRRYGWKMKIKEIRALTGLTQKQFAEKYHITFSSIRNWESGHRTCPDYVAELLEFKVREDLKNVQNDDEKE